jgi:MFS transporter, DHA1 family, multidrug resistance protein
MKRLYLPPVWLIILVVGLPILSETVYTPSLPNIAHDLHASESMAEYTLTIYLFGFALGTLLFGKLSDKFGRKPCIIAGFIVFILGCLGCYFSSTIEMLMLSRFIQAFGGSVGSVLGQSVARDAFHGVELGKVYSSIGGALAVFPSVGPVIGGMIVEYTRWPNIFLFLVLSALILSLMVCLWLPETHHINNRKSVPVLSVAAQLLKDKRIIGLGLIVGGAHGINFSYFAEGSFYMISGLGLSPAQYGVSFIILALATASGGVISRRLHRSHDSNRIMGYGLKSILVSSGIFVVLALTHAYFWTLPVYTMVCLSLLSQMGIMCGVSMSTSNALAVALVDYKWCIGTASSLFGFFYYAIISLFTLGMGLFHNGTLIPMPVYFFAIGIFMQMVQKCLINKN